MSDLDFIFSIGPVESADGPSHFLHVTPGYDDAQVFAGDTLEGALKDLLGEYKAEELCCEAALTALCEAHGIAAEDYTPSRAHALALAAFDLVEPGPMDEIERTGLVYRFCQAAERYLAIKPWETIKGTVRLAVAFGDDAPYPAYALLLGAAGDAMGIVMFDSEDDLNDAVSAIGRGDWARALSRDCIGMTLQSEPDFAIHALKRSHGLNAVPTPFVIAKGQQARAYDEDLASMSAALFAVAEMAEKQDDSTYGELTMGDLSVVVNASTAE